MCRMHVLVSDIGFTVVSLTRGGDSALLTTEQSAKINHYMGVYWHCNSAIKLACIDAKFLELRYEKKVPYVASTGSNEGHHSLFDSLIFRRQVNTSVCRVISKVLVAFCYFPS